MTTRATLRAALRGRLEDLGAGPLWDDALLDEAIAAAIRRYGQALPAHRMLSLTLAAGARSAVLAEDVQDDRIVAVIDPAGTRVPRHRAVPGDDAAPPGQAWRAWGGVLALDRPAAPGAWRVEYRAARARPGSDAVAIDVATGDEEIVLGLATAAALDQRVVADAKRGTANGALGTRAEMSRQAAERALTHRRRVVRGAWRG
ncbi:MAG: hypothetical protein WKF80_06275 [Thermomicrobiales bacterium]